MSYDHAANARQRATHLRTLAAQMVHTPAMSLHVHAGVDTWHGPRADACIDQLRRAQQQVHRAADELDARALRLEREAEALEAAAFRAARELELRRAVAHRSETPRHST